MLWRVYQTQINDVDYEWAIKMNDDSRVKLVDVVTCPYCWNQFPPEDVYWIARHSQLSGDAVAGASELHRFLPSRFTLTGKAIDEKGNHSEDIACPVCHGFLPKAILEMPPLCFSVLGAPASGKSFFLGAMLQRMKHVFTKNFELEVESAAPAQNQMILNYQRTLFEYDDPDSMKILDKTQVQGAKGLYREVRLNDEDSTLSIPCMFSIKPSQKHPLHDQNFFSRMLCLYDCAGEYFDPDSGLSNSLVIKHLENSDMLLFVYDPFMESDFRRACANVTQDPQVQNEKYRRTKDQSSVLSYAADLIRRGGNHPARWKYDRPLVVLVNKFDGWHALLKEDANRLDDAIVQLENNMEGLDLKILQEVSDRVRKLLREQSSGIVTAAESFADEVFYIPATSTGVAPEIIKKQSVTTESDDIAFSLVDEEAQSSPRQEIDLGFRAGNLKPKWTEVPLLLALSRSGQRRSSDSLIMSQESYEQVIPLRNRRSGG